MATRSSSITGTRWGCAGIVLLSACLLPFLVARAGAATEKTRVVYHAAKVEVVEVGDVPGHVVGVVVNKGLAFAENGDVGTHSNFVTFDYVNGTGTHEGYGVTTWPDGSTQVSRNQGRATAAAAGQGSSFEGAFEYTGGSGRFQGIQGKGSYTGRRVAPLSEGADAYLDLTAAVTLPPR